MDTPGARLHSDHPFVPPPEQRVPLRRLRGRLPAAVTLWTAAAGGEQAGLTVSSVLVVEPDVLLGVVGPDTDLADLLEPGAAATVQVLDWRHRRLAEVFAFLAPAPGGPFRTATWTGTGWGPVLDPAPTWAGVRVRTTREVGWGLLVEADVEHVHVEDPPPDDVLAHHRGDYRHLT